MRNDEIKADALLHAGFHLAFFEKPLFNEEIKAWMYEPVVLNPFRNTLEISTYMGRMCY